MQWKNGLLAIISSITKVTTKHHNDHPCILAAANNFCNIFMHHNMQRGRMISTAFTGKRGQRGIREMSTMTTARRTAGEILVPDELERRQIFHNLKKASSYTGRKRILGFYQKWAKATEESVRVADNSGILPVIEAGVVKNPGKTSIHYSHYVNILRAVATYEEGVTRLGKGDKRVFLCDVANGFFVRAAGEISYWSNLKGRVDRGETGWEETTPYSKEFFKAFVDLCGAFSESRNIGEIQNPSTPAPLRYGLWEAVFLSRLPYPEPLPDVPEPKEEIVVTTGARVSCSGIWEPENEGRCVGSMNYLHGGAIAPKFKRTYLNPQNEWGMTAENVLTAWRLIWRDNRYEDGTIPEEEKNYPFLCPVPEGVEDPYNLVPLEYIRKHKIPHPFLEGIAPTLDQVDGGKHCTRKGYWWAPAKDISR
jgi:hypothetical protein